MAPKDEEDGIEEACHFVDLSRHLTGTSILAARVSALGESGGTPKKDDVASITLEFADGCVGTIHYLANGHKSFPEERLEVFTVGRVLILDNFSSLRATDSRGSEQLDSGAKTRAIAHGHVLS